MLTRSNIKTVLQSIPVEKIREVMYGPKDYIYLRLSIFNIGWSAHIEEVEYNEEAEDEAISEGAIFWDKDTFALLLDENNIIL